MNTEQKTEKAPDTNVNNQSGRTSAEQSLRSVDEANLRLSLGEQLRHERIRDVAIEVLCAELSLEDEMVRDQLPNFFNPFRLAAFSSVGKLSGDIQQWFFNVAPVKAILKLKESPAFILINRYHGSAAHLNRIDFPEIRTDLEKLGPARSEREATLMQAIIEVASFLEASDYYRSLIASYNKRFLD